MWKRIINSLSINALLGALAVVCALSAVSIARQAIQISRDSVGASARLEELMAKKKELESRIREQEMDEVVRYQAKARFNLKNPGENIVVVLPDTKEIPPDGAGDHSLWERIKSFFAGVLRR